MEFLIFILNDSVSDSWKCCEQYFQESGNRINDKSIKLNNSGTVVKIGLQKKC